MTRRFQPTKARQTILLRWWAHQAIYSFVCFSIPLEYFIDEQFPEESINQ
jgi:hypothetical protein